MAGMGKIDAARSKTESKQERSKEVSNCRFQAYTRSMLNVRGLCGA